MLRRALALPVVCCAGLRRTRRASACPAIAALQRRCHDACAGPSASTHHRKDLQIMHTEAFHTALALIDHLAVLVPRVALHDPRLARALRQSATAIPVLLAAGQLARPALLTRAHAVACRVHVMLTVIEAWAYVPADDLAEAQDTASRLTRLTASS
jgi:hypothetical protein